MIVGSCLCGHYESCELCLNNVKNIKPHMKNIKPSVIAMYMAAAIEGKTIRATPLDVGEFLFDYNGKYCGLFTGSGIDEAYQYNKEHDKEIT